MSKVRITGEQQERIAMAAIRTLDVAGEDDLRTLKLAFIGAAEDPFDLSSLLAVIERMNAAVVAELKVMNFEAGDQLLPSQAKH